MSLYPRYATTALTAALQDTPVVCLLGPRQVGKTTLVREHLPDQRYLSLDDPNLFTAAKVDPLGFVRGLPERVTIDEVQRVPELFPIIKLSVDENRDSGRFLLTGSANLRLLPQVQESLAGRMEIVRLHPLSELEKQHGERSLLRYLVEGALEPRIIDSGRIIDGLAKAVCGGGYPEPNTRSRQGARRWFQNYVESIIQRDVRDIAEVYKEEELLKLVSLLAHRTANLLNISNIAKVLGIDRDTTVRYLTILERLFLVRRLPAWHRNRAKRLIKSPKIHVVDSGLAAHALRLTESDWDSHGSEFGGLLESFVVQQLICQADWFDDGLTFSHYRDKEQLEVDLVIERGREVWGVEVKRAASFNASDGVGLAKLAEQAGSQFKGGVLLYSGTNCLPLSTAGCFAVPTDWLWRDQSTPA